ncbi:10451_t:CDS:2, partial [Acaulospora colombiana]
NLKDKIMEYENLFKSNPRLVIKASSVEFVNESLRDNKSFDKKLFLSILLGYFFGESVNSLYELPSRFQAIPLLEVLLKIDESTLPSGTVQKIHPAIVPLIRHNIRSGSFEWLNFFAVAKLLDPKYDFVDHIPEQNYSEKNMDTFLKLLKLQVCPHLDQLEDDDVYVRIAKWSLKQCNSMKSIVEVWNNIIIHTEARDVHLFKYFRERTQKIVKSIDIPADLCSQFTALPDDLKDLTTEMFRKQALHILGLHFNRDWIKEQAEAIRELFFLNEQLGWTRQEYTSLLDTISECSDLELLTSFPKLLEFWRTSFEDPHDKDLPNICKKWYRKLLERGSGITALKDKY